MSTTAPCPLLINGEWLRPAALATSPVFNPSTGEVIGAVPLAGAAEVDAAVQAAQAAFPAWADTPVVDRTRIMFRYRSLVEKHFDEIARTISREHGKTCAESRGDLFRGIEAIEYACGAPTLMMGDMVTNIARSVDCETTRYPLGVCVGITPFNFPAMVPMWMFANAIACGNSFILKPSEKDPSASMLLAELTSQAGLPEGVFNVVHGDKEAVDALLANPDVAAVSFVGSTPIARSIYETATRNGKRVQALGGAKNHMLVLPDADLDMAADAAISAGYGSAGERCMAISVVLAMDSIADELIAKIVERIPAIKVGPGIEPDSEMGPLITGEHRDKVASYVAGATGEGATVVVDGTTGVPDGGFYLNPSLLDQVKPGMACYDDEIFGPVLSVARISNYEEGLRLINENPYGNGVAIFTRDGGAARSFQFDVEVGMVGINVPIPVPVSYYSFGGWKASLFGDQHMYGPEGINFFSRAKVVTSRWPEPSTSSVNLGFPENR